MASFLRNLWYFSATEDPSASIVPSTDQSRQSRPPSMVVEISGISVRGLPSPASSVQIKVEQRGDAIQSSVIAPSTSLSWSGSAFSQSKLAIHPSSKLFLIFIDKGHCIFEVEVLILDIVAGFSGKLESNACAYTARDLNNNPVELQFVLGIHSCPKAPSSQIIANSITSGIASDMAQLGSLLENYVALERLYGGSHRVHPLVKAFITPTLFTVLFSSGWNTLYSPPTPSQSEEDVLFGMPRLMPVPTPFLETVLSMNSLIAPLLRNSFTIPQQHQSLLNQVFAELCRCAALLEEVDEHFKGSEDMYRIRQEQLFILLCKITFLFCKKRSPDEFPDKDIAVAELLGYISKEDAEYHILNAPSNQYERYNRPFTTALASPRGYERKQVWNIVILEKTQDASVRDTCRRSLLRLIQVSRNAVPELSVGDHVKLQGPRKPGTGAIVWRASAGCNEFLAFKTSTLLDTRLNDPQTRQTILLAFVTWKYLEHPRILPFLGIQVMYTGQRYATCLAYPWLGSRELTNKRITPTLKDEKVRRRYIKEIVEGMAYLHSVGVVHGNLKLANIFKGNDEHILIADYGTWQFADRMQGKTRWIAPEQWDTVAAIENGPIIPTMKSDVYSFANLCTELYTGTKPWGDTMDESEIEAAVRLRDRHPPYPHGIPDDLWEILLKCWARNPKQRPDFVTIGQWLKN
ncbi:kinase-like domain-containing protein [Irpex rosettiformis]|uniref:Kinase-like domain-containing protein n=1 Tax=Irpex rosettiformis TaxID=378272 RepID=A0ACB8U2Y7_9APHY|nr:kinase-like domain-containing protein [Irpex rosettiformis]